jgi:hypothetical protein
VWSNSSTLGPYVNNKTTERYQALLDGTSSIDAAMRPIMDQANFNIQMTYPVNCTYQTIFTLAGNDAICCNCK